MYYSEYYNYKLEVKSTTICLTSSMSLPLLITELFPFCPSWSSSTICWKFLTNLSVNKLHFLKKIFSKFSMSSSSYNNCIITLTYINYFLYECFYTYLFPN